MNQVAYNNNFTSSESVGNYANYNQINANNDISNNTIYNQQQVQQQATYFQPIIYPSYDFYPCINNAYSYPFSNFAQYPQAKCQPQIVNQQNFAYITPNHSHPASSMSFQPLVNSNFQYMSTMTQDQLNLSNNNGFSSSDMISSSDLSDDDDDSFGSIFQPLSVLQEKQRKREQLNQLLNSNQYIEKPKKVFNPQNMLNEKSLQFKEYEIERKENESIVENMNCSCNEDKDNVKMTQNLQRNKLEMNIKSNSTQTPPQPQKLEEKVSKENQDNQKVFKPKTFKEIEAEEKKSKKSQVKESKKESELRPINQKQSNNRKNNSFKRGRKIW